MARKKASPQNRQTLEVRQQNNMIWSHVRQKWLVNTPEERVRQNYLCVLVNEYGYFLEQIDEELSVTGRGSGGARADFLIWRTVQERREGKTALIVVECKADNVTINQATYEQGSNYAQYERAKFFVTHNNRETKFWQVDLEKRAPNFFEVENIPKAGASDKDIDELFSKLKIFREDEFADLLHQCHNIIRNREKKDPAAAFDEIAKILFVKTGIERKLRHGNSSDNLFTSSFLGREKVIHDDPINVLFKQTKQDYKADRIFEEDETINLKFNTVREIVEKLERYNLSDTSEDIKGIAFERFLGQTFRGEIGQFFTPRPVVEFMIRMMNPQEGDKICDPASGSGGFLIRFFEIVRQSILQDADEKYQAYKQEIEQRDDLNDEEKAQLLTAEFEKIQKTIDQSKKNSRLWNLANRCIYGTDANDRMARTSKMNMIMHGDGHGGVHHHDGFININGIFENRFDIVLTNPPFGSNVEASDVVLESEITIPSEVEERYRKEYGQAYEEATARIRGHQGKAIAELYKLPKRNKKGEVTGKTKTEIIFLERCLDLLKPGGRLGIVLPEGTLNNPSLAYVREFCEDRAFVRSVVSLPQETFVSSGTTVKTSLVFMQKFTEKEKQEFDRIYQVAKEETDKKYEPEIQAEIERFDREIEKAKQAKDTEGRKELQKEKKAYLNQMQKLKIAVSRALLKERFAYPIFLYNAEKVGITSTGEADQNELYPNDNQPQDIEKTCLELYQEFRENPDPFFVSSLGN